MIKVKTRLFSFLMAVVMLFNIAVMNAVPAFASLPPFTVDGITYSSFNSSFNPNTVMIMSVDTTLKGHIVIPEKVTNNNITYTVAELWGWAIYDRPDITSVSLPSTLTFFDGRSFNYTGITYLDLSHLTNLTEMGDWMYGCISYCENLETVILPPNITQIHNWTFRECPSLTSIVIPPSVTSISHSSGLSFPNPNLTIIGVPGSYAEKHAQDYNIKFEPSTPKTYNLIVRTAVNNIIVHNQTAVSYAANTDVNIIPDTSTFDFNNYTYQFDGWVVNLGGGVVLDPTQENSVYHTTNVHSVLTAHYIEIPKP